MGQEKTTQTLPRSFDRWLLAVLAVSVALSVFGYYLASADDNDNGLFVVSVPIGIAVATSIWISLLNLAITSKRIRTYVYLGLQFSVLGLAGGTCILGNLGYLHSYAAIGYGFSIGAVLTSLFWILLITASLEKSRPSQPEVREHHE